MIDRWLTQSVEGVRVGLPLPEPHEGAYVDPGGISPDEMASDAFPVLALGTAQIRTFRGGGSIALEMGLETTADFGLIDWAEFEYLYWLACGLGLPNNTWQDVGDTPAGTFDPVSDPANTWASQTVPGGTFSDEGDPVNGWVQC